ncbi:MAG: SDR family oxidoreductase [Simkaniaceae bacterium]
MDEKMKAIITGANRGIGLALAKELINKNFEVFALCRSSSPELEKLGAVIFEGIDVTDEQSLKKALQGLEKHKIDLLINNAGILENNPLDAIDYESILHQFDVNALGALKTTLTFLPQLKAGSKIIMITSRMGSIGDNTSGGYYGYRISKAALNMIGKSLAIDLKPSKIAVGLVHPGFVRTQMVSFSGNLEPEQAAKGIIQRIDELTLANSGGFWHSNGEELPW